MHLKMMKGKHKNCKTISSYSTGFSINRVHIPQARIIKLHSGTMQYCRSNTI